MEPIRTDLAGLRAESGAVVAGLRLVVATTRNGRDRNEDVVGMNGWVISGEPARPLQVVLPVGPGMPAAVALADGMGGAPAGDRAARLAAELLTCVIPSAEPGLAQLPEVFRDTHAAIREAARGTHHGMGCTAALIVVYADGTAVVGNVGDVRAYRLVDGYAGQLTEDHRPHATGSLVSKCLGGVHQAPSSPGLHQLVLRHRDRLVLCSDGVHDVTEAAGIEDAVRRGAGVEAATALLAVVEAAGPGDNATVAVLDVVGRHADVTGRSQVSELPDPARDTTSAPTRVRTRRRGLLRLWSR